MTTNALAQAVKIADPIILGSKVVCLESKSLDTSFSSSGLRTQSREFVRVMLIYEY